MKLRFIGDGRGVVRYRDEKVPEGETIDLKKGVAETLAATEDWEMA